MMYASVADMAEHSTKSGSDSDQQTQNEGYDEAAHGGKDVPASDVGIPISDRDRERLSGDPFDREAAEAANDVRRREHSAD